MNLIPWSRKGSDYSLSLRTRRERAGVRGGDSMSRDTIVILQTGCAPSRLPFSHECRGEGNTGLAARGSTVWKRSF